MAGFLAGFSTKPKSPPLSRQTGGILGKIVAEFGHFVVKRGSAAGEPTAAVLVADDVVVVAVIVVMVVLLMVCGTRPLLTHSVLGCRSRTSALKEAEIGKPFEMV